MKQGVRTDGAARRGANLRPRRPGPFRRAMAITTAAAASLIAALTVAAAAATAMPIGCSKVKRGGIACPRVTYKFQTINDPADPTFNQLLGINTQGVIAGYFGSGAAGRPNQGYLLFPPYFQNYYANNNFPNSVQTQVTGLNNNGVIVGFQSLDEQRQPGQ